MFRLQTDAKALQFSFLPAENLPMFVCGDEKRLRQVAEFSVTDTGIGIAEENLSRIFNPFERVEDEGQAGVPGTGLGLTITKLLSEIMGRSGWDLARRLREEGHGDAVLIMVSANADESGRDPLHRIYHDDYLVKP
ncbi:Virulence sensor protein BvgS, partial [Durusdinium trenchii]